MIKSYYQRVKPLMEEYGFVFSNYGKTISINRKVVSSDTSTKSIAMSSALEKYFRGNKFHYVYLNKARTLIENKKMLKIALGKE